MIGGGVFSRGARVRMTSGGAGAGCGSRTSLMISGPGDGGVGGRTKSRRSIQNGNSCSNTICFSYGNERSLVVCT